MNYSVSTASQHEGDMMEDERCPTLWEKTLLPGLQNAPEQKFSFVYHDGGQYERTFAEIMDDVMRVGLILKKLGIKASDPVGVAGRNGYAWLLADLSLLSVGSVPVALPVEETADDINQAAERLGLKALLTADLPDDDPTEGQTLAPGIKFRSGNLPARAIPYGVATISFSSGTTGEKKAIALTHAGINRTISLSGRSWGINSDDRILVVLPFSNFQQRLLCNVSIRYGAASAIIPHPRLYQMMARVQPSVVLGPPSFFDILTRIPNWTSVFGEHIRLMLTGSAPVPPALLDFASDHEIPLYEVYGSTEVGWISMNLPQAFKRGSSGRPVPGLSVAFDVDGELIVRSDANQARCYVWGTDPEQATFRSDGWIATGDLGYLDDDGYLVLNGRKKSILITRSGVKLNPEAIERLIDGHHTVIRSCVQLSTDHSILHGVVWIDNPQSIEEHAVRAHITRINRTLPSYSRVATLMFRPATELTVESGILTGNQKLNRRAVAKLCISKGCCND
ncbi:AMP-binding protein [Mycobacterium gordonae]|uniref:AMP-binding protein n=1 Tax=Mycobacterium gordonae TaxID=1778 RepID=UPI0009E8F0C4|nr:AMP-binding protein [Mycobacterium gordonae]